MTRRHPGQSRIQRVLDIVVATIVLALATPLLALAALAILLEDGRPVLFGQTRIGLAGQTFRLWKLRSMRCNQLEPQEVGQVTATHPLVTRVGRGLRRTNLDELPQLVNVIRGDMSLVGPRPALPEQLATYDAFQRRRLEVRPGLTGWAQINGNVELSWEERILLDVWYVDHRSLAVDLSILLRTVAVLATGERRRQPIVEEARSHAERSRRGRRLEPDCPADTDR